MTITDRQVAAANLAPWLRAAYHQAEMVRQALTDAGLTGGADASSGGIDTPDTLVGGRHAIDVIPDTSVSRAAHLGRAGVESPEQLVTYAPAAPEYLAEVFRHGPGV